MLATALILTCNPTDGEDLVGETVAKAWAKRDELREWRSFEAWIQRILSNASRRIRVSCCCGILGFSRAPTH